MTLLSNERFSRSASTKTGLCLRLPNKTLHVLSCAWDPLSKAASRPLDMRLRTRVFPTRKETLRMADRVGQILGNYQLLRLLGRGAFTEVYLAEHRYLEALLPSRSFMCAWSRTPKSSFCARPARSRTCSIPILCAYSTLASITRPRFWLWSILPMAPCAHSILKGHGSP